MVNVWWTSSWRCHYLLRVAQIDLSWLEGLRSKCEITRGSQWKSRDSWKYEMRQCVILYLLDVHSTVMFQSQRWRTWTKAFRCDNWDVRKSLPSRRYSRMRNSLAWNDCLLLVNANSRRVTALKRWFSSDVSVQMLTSTCPARITRSSAIWSSVVGRSTPSLRPSKYCWVYRVTRADSASMVRSGALRL